MAAPSGPPVESRLSRLTPVLSCLLPLLGVVAAPATAAVPLYAEVQVGASGVRHSDLDFVSPIASLVLGTWVLPGIGIEAFADGELDRGSEDGFETGLEHAYGGALRLSSPERDGIRGYVLLGYVDFTIAQRDLVTGATIDERFTGARFGIGLQQRLERFPSLLFGVEYRNFYTAESIQADGLVLGLRYDLR